MEKATSNFLFFFIGHKYSSLTSGRSCNKKIWSGIPAPRFIWQYMEVFTMVNVSKEGQVFRCEICGNVVVVKESGGGELVCCGEPMQLESA